jgi:phage-related protein (TIGR01555 family)
MTKRFDGWLNVYKQLNVENKDPRTGSGIKHSTLTQEQAELLYSSDTEASKIVSILPREALREGISFNNLEAADNKKIQELMNNLNVLTKFEEAWHDARLYGGAVILLSVSDGLDLDEELEVNRIDSINALTVLNRYEIEADTTSIITDLTDKNFGLPEYYTLNSDLLVDNSATKIHISRLIRFDGEHLPKGTFRNNNYWHDSILSKLYDALEGFGNSSNALAGVLPEFKQGILKIKDIADLLASGKEEDILNRLKVFDMGKVYYKTAVIDGEEDYTIHHTNFAGIKDVMDKVEQRLVAASNIPATKLLGKSPTGGLSGKGESENRDFYDYVASEQEKYLQPKLQYLFNIINNMNNTGLQGKDLSYTFNPLWQMDEKEIAEIRKIMSETDEKYINTGVLTPAEVSTSRFGGTYTIETQLDETLNREPVEPIDDDD